MSTSLTRSVSGNGLRRDEPVDGQRDGPARLGVELDVDDRPVGVPLAVADLVRVGVEPDDGLGRVLAPASSVASGPGKPTASVADAERLAGLPVLGLDGEERLRVGTSPARVRGSRGPAAGPSIT